MTPNAAVSSRGSTGGGVWGFTIGGLSALGAWCACGTACGITVGTPAALGAKPGSSVVPREISMPWTVRSGCGELEPAPGAVEALARLKPKAEILILSNAPASAERLRGDWLRRHGLPHTLILSSGPKGPITAGLTAQCAGKTAFIDDLLSNLDSVAEHSPRTARFQHVADLRLRALAPRSDAHPRIDDWAQLGEAIERAIS